MLLIFDVKSLQKFETGTMYKNITLITSSTQDAYELLRTDSVAFEYLFVQCCNDVVQVH